MKRPEKLSQSVSGWHHLKKTSKHTTHEAEATEMRTAPVTVYKPALSVSHSETGIHAGRSVRQEVVKVMCVMNRDVPLIIARTAWKQWKEEGYGRGCCLLLGVNVVGLTSCVNHMSHRPCECFSLVGMSWTKRLFKVSHSISHTYLSFCSNFQTRNIIPDWL